MLKKFNAKIKQTKQHSWEFSLRTAFKAFLRYHFQKQTLKSEFLRAGKFQFESRAYQFLGGRLLPTVTECLVAKN